MQMRYNRSPSSSMDPPLTGGYGGQHHAPPPQPPPLSRSKGITTMTTMTISNLSDTVSKNDIAVSQTHTHTHTCLLHATTYMYASICSILCTGAVWGSWFPGDSLYGSSWSG